MLQLLAAIEPVAAIRWIGDALGGFFGLPSSFMAFFLDCIFDPISRSFFIRLEGFSESSD